MKQNILYLQQAGPRARRQRASAHAYFAQLFSLYMSSGILPVLLLILVVLLWLLTRLR
jgi:hypothetical protein